MSDEQDKCPQGCGADWDDVHQRWNCGTRVSSPSHAPLYLVSPECKDHQIAALKQKIEGLEWELQRAKQVIRDREAERDRLCRELQHFVDTAKLIQWGPVMYELRRTVAAPVMVELRALAEREEES